MLGIPSCKQVSELSSQRLDEPLPLWRRAGFRAHLFICQSCREYVKHMSTTRRVVRLWLDAKVMPPAVKNKLLAQFKKSSESEQPKR